MTERYQSFGNPDDDKTVDELTKEFQDLLETIVTPEEIEATKEAFERDLPPERDVPPAKD